MVKGFNIELQSKESIQFLKCMYKVVDFTAIQLYIFPGV